MGYDQWIQLEIYREGFDAETLLIALSLAFPRFTTRLSEDNDSGSLIDSDEGEKIIFTCNGRHLYDKGGLLFEEFSAQEISKEIGCTIEIYYEGEEKLDAEQLKFVNGQKVEHKILDWVDVKDS